MRCLECWFIENTMLLSLFNPFDSEGLYYLEKTACILDRLRI